MRLSKDMRMWFVVTLDGINQVLYFYVVYICSNLFRPSDGNLSFSEHMTISIVNQI